MTPVVSTAVKRLGIAAILMLIALTIAFSEVPANPSGKQAESKPAVQLNSYRTQAQLCPPDIGKVDTVSRSELKTAVAELPFEGRNPCIAVGGNGRMMVAAESPDPPYRTIFLGSMDYGYSWQSLISHHVSGQFLPSVAFFSYSSSDDLHFDATATPIDADQGIIWWTHIYESLGSFSEYSVEYDFSSEGYYNIEFAEMIRDSTTSITRIGLVIGKDADSSVAAIYNRSLAEGDYVISRLDFPYCRSVTGDIDYSGHFAYTVWEWYDTSASQSKLLIRGDNDPYYEENFADAQVWELSTGQHIQYPGVAAHNDTAVVVFQFYDESFPDTSDRDIYSWTFVGGDLTSHGATIPVSTTSSIESFPVVSHVENNEFNCVFSVGDSLVVSTTTNGGGSWSTPELLSGMAETVPNEYRTADISGVGRIAVRQYVEEGGSDTLVSIMYLENDDDEDLVPDNLDNCVGVFNPDQEDGDLDGAGDSCDYVTPMFSTYDQQTAGAPGLTIDFYDRSYGLSEITEWLWFFGDGDSSLLEHPQHTYLTEGLFDITLIASDGVNEDTLVEEDYVYVSGYPVDYEIDTVGEYDVRKLIAVDLDQDNNADLLWTFKDGSNITLSVSYGNSLLEFTEPDLYLLASYSGTIGPSGLAAGFVDGDEHLDVLARTEDSLIVLLNDGSRSFFVEHSYGFAPGSFGDFEVPVIVGYFDDDVHLDAIISAEAGAQVLLGEGNGAFQQGTSFADEFTAATVLDLNQDGFDDVVLCMWDFTGMYLNDGEGNFTETTRLYISDYFAEDVASANATADFDRNGTLDFAVTTSMLDIDSLTIVYGDGTGGVSRTTSIAIEDIARSLIVTDANRDGWLDVVIGNFHGRMEVYMGDGVDIVPVPYVIDLGGDHYSLWDFDVADFDRDGNADFVVGGPSVYYPLRLVVSTLPDVLVLLDEMVTTGYEGVSVSVHNEDGFFISKSGSTVAGSAYWRRDFDDSGILDEATADYNLQYGEYTITVCPRSGDSPPFTAGVRIDGTSHHTFFHDYSDWVKKDGRTDDSIRFYFNYESAWSTDPYNGEAVGNQKPFFDWSGLDNYVSMADSFIFEISRFHDLREVRLTDTVLVPYLNLPIELGLDSVFYWHIIACATGTCDDTSRVFAVYCVDAITGDANASGSVDIDDAVYLINYIFAGGPAPDPIEMGDVECSGGVDIDDVVYLIAYIFSGGPSPGDPNNDGIPDC